MAPHDHFVRCPPRGRVRPFGRPGGRTCRPHAHVVRCTPRGRLRPFGRPGGPDMANSEALRDLQARLAERHAVGAHRANASTSWLAVECRRRTASCSRCRPGRRDLLDRHGLLAAAAHPAVVLPAWPTCAASLHGVVDLGRRSLGLRAARSGRPDELPRATQSQPRRPERLRSVQPVRAAGRPAGRPAPAPDQMTARARQADGPRPAVRPQPAGATPQGRPNGRKSISRSSRAHEQFLWRSRPRWPK